MILYIGCKRDDDLINITIVPQALFVADVTRPQSVFPWRAVRRSTRTSSKTTIGPGRRAVIGPGREL